MVSHHGQSALYMHDVLGVNCARYHTSGGLKAKLKHLDEYASARNKAADYYDKRSPIIQIKNTGAFKTVTHVFHQYTLQLTIRQDKLREQLAEHGIRP